MIASLFDDRPDHLRSKAVLTCVFLIAANIAAWAWAWFAFPITLPCSARPCSLIRLG